ncbi:hypothetical protein BCV71DRAFT_279022, partial [Rhizopus microsporus]
FYKKIKLDTILMPEYKALLTTKLLIVSEHVRSIMMRAQLFTNYYVITHADQTIDKRVFTQDLWYCITQLVLSNGYSQCVTSACVDMASTYTNSAVECFEGRLSSYLFGSVKELLKR